MKARILGALASLVFCVLAQASPVMPSFATAPAGWSVDRYSPDAFGNIGTYQGANNVLEIGIGATGAYNNRPVPYQSTFYDTQGMGHAISGGAGDSLTAYLYVPTSWADPTNGARRTDMWGVMTDGTTNVTGYPIIGFTNEGTSGFVGFRTWNDTTGVWDDLGNMVNYGSWNELTIAFTGAVYDYSVNGVLADTIAAAPGTTNFSLVLEQAYSFLDDPAWSGFVANAYNADWSNDGAGPTAVKEPGALTLAGVALLGLFFIRRKVAQRV